MNEFYYYPPPTLAPPPVMSVIFLDNLDFDNFASSQVCSYVGEYAPDHAYDVWNGEAWKENTRGRIWADLTKYRTRYLPAPTWKGWDTLIFF